MTSEGLTTGLGAPIGSSAAAMSSLPPSEHDDGLFEGFEGSLGDAIGSIAADPDDSAGKLFIGGVSWQTTEEGLRYYFEKFGELIDVALMKNKHTGQPRGFGFVKFRDSSVVDAVLSQEHTIDSRTVDVKRAVPRDKAPVSATKAVAVPAAAIAAKPVIETKKIFVGGLAPTVTEAEFRSYFDKFGKITDAVVMFDRQTQRSRGFGFITFENEGSVRQVMQTQHELKGKPVEVKAAEPKEARPPQPLSFGESRPPIAANCAPPPPNYGANTNGSGAGKGLSRDDFGGSYSMYDINCGGRSGCGASNSGGCAPFGFGFGLPGGNCGYLGGDEIPYSLLSGGFPGGGGFCRGGYSGRSDGSSIGGGYAQGSGSGAPSQGYGAPHGTPSQDASFNNTGYGGYRGQAAAHGRESRSYRPY